MYTIQQLIESSKNVHSKNKTNEDQYSMLRALSKHFGTVYYNDKVILYDENSGIIEIRMMVGTYSETNYTGVHAVRFAIYGVKGKVYNSIQELYEDQFGKVDKRTKDYKNGIAEIDSTIGKVVTDKGILNHTGNDYDAPERLDVAGPGQLNNRLRGFVIPVANTDTTSFGKSFEASDKFFYSTDTIDFNKVVRVSCSCSDYYYTFGWYNYNHGAHLGVKPTPYKKNFGNRKPVRNITKEPGMCKHLMLFVTLLLNGGILQSAEYLNTLNSLEYSVARSNIEHLRVPKRLITGPELDRMTSKLSKDLKKVQEKRNKLVDLDKGYIEGYDQFQRDISRANYAAGTNLRKGTSKAAYMNSFMSKNASSAMKNVYEALQKQDKQRKKNIQRVERQQNNSVHYNTHDIKGFKVNKPAEVSKTRISRDAYKDMRRDLFRSGFSINEIDEEMKNYIIED